MIAVLRRGAYRLLRQVPFRNKPMKLSFEKIRSMLYESIKPTGHGSDRISCWVREVYTDEFVYYKNDKLYKAPYKIEDNDVVIGKAVEVKEEVEYVPVFSAERLFSAFKETLDDGTVVRRGKVFEAGDFPDKNVAFDESDLARAVDSFTPVDNDLEHASTILDGKLGRLARVWKQGEDIFGEVEIPEWLDKAIGDEAIKVSLAFDRSKNIVGNALVLRPRIADAAIMSAFSSSQQKPAVKGAKTEKDKPMKLKDAIKHLFGLDQVEDLEVEVTLPEASAQSAPPTPPAADEKTPAPPDPSPTFSKEVDARFAAMESQLLGERASAFANEVVRNKKALPAQCAHVAAMFVNAVRSDAGTGPVFSAETNSLVEGPAVAAVRAFFNDAPSHRMLGEAIPGDGVTVVFSGQATDKLSADRQTELLNKSALGTKAAEAAAKK